jgi:hypothetical protein
MQLYVDESGSFIPGAPQLGSWCVVAAYVQPEAAQGAAQAALACLKHASGRDPTNEIKLRDLDEASYLTLLETLAGLDGTMYACAVDAHHNSLAVVEQHLAGQLAAVRENIPRVHAAHVRAGLSAQADRYAAMSPQLYLQQVCQFQLLAAIIRQAVLYYVQRHPESLARFAWRIDQKNAVNSIFDEALRHYVGPMLQGISFRAPSPMLIGSDYSHFRRFFYEDGPPVYLKETYGLEVGDGFNITKVMHEDLRFVDSDQDEGVQIADLLASGLRRCLRGGFANNLAMADALGRLMVDAPKPDPPLELVTIDSHAVVDRHSPAYAAIRRMQQVARPMLRR